MKKTNIINVGYIDMFYDYYFTIKYIIIGAVTHKNEF